MKVSIVTVVWNNKDTIKYAIESVLSQTYPNVEYIIIDGASTDSTIEIIKGYGNKINKFISEPDHGIYDAMNKGLKLATGDVIGILNSDDMYINNHIIEKIIKIFELHNVDSLFADLVFVRSDNLERTIRYYDSSKCLPNNFKKALYPAHPTFFVKREIYEKYGYFKTDYKIAADFDLMARFLYTHNISYYYLQEPIIKMRIGGVSTSLKSLYINTIEQLRVCKENGIKTNIGQILLKYPSKLIGLIRK
ncbi:MAG: glycosyl transferase, family 2 [Proteobacteria bacterium]|nr:glycosyl transferase, family 2 [Pseudomonadota bacterium]